MKDGFIKVAAATPKVKVADPEYNTKEIIKIIRQAGDEEASLLVFSELAVSGYTCGDLFLQDPLLEESLKGLMEIKKETKGMDMVVTVGCPLVVEHKLYNCGVFLFDGRI